MNAHVARTRPPATTPSPWLPLWLALAALLATPVVGLLMRLVRAATDPGTGRGGGVSPGMLGVAATVLVAGAGVWVALRELRHGTRSWPVWTGLVVSAVLLLLWLAFAAGELLFPH